MQHRQADFFDRAGPFTLRQIAEHVGATLLDESAGARAIEDVRPLGTAGPSDLSFFDNRRYAEQLTTTDAGACIVSKGDTPRVPASAAVAAGGRLVGGVPRGPARRRPKPRT